MELARNNHRWFALQVKPRQEFSTAKLLRDKGYEEFLPSYRQVRQWSDRQKVFEAPLFAGYVFCRFDAGLSAPLITTPGVIRIVGSARGATPIEESEIAAIQAITRHGFKATPCPYARIGDKVRITNGPLAGIEGVLKADKNQHHFILTVECVQSSIAVEVSCTNIELVPAA
jgi:transcription antitermination factor NusG